MYKCKVCEKEFELKKEEYYVARDDVMTGLNRIANGREEQLYDTFDCPYCGCQNVMQPRKRQCVDEVEKCFVESEYDEFNNDGCDPYEADCAGDEM